MGQQLFGRANSCPRLTSVFNGDVPQPHNWNGMQTFLNDRGQTIRYGHAPAITEDVRGTVVLTHGYGENIDLFHEAIDFYQHQGFEVFAMDWQGFGLSQRDEPGSRIPSGENLERHADDLNQFVTEIVKPQAVDGPIITSTHSMGGHFTLLALEKYPHLFDGAVMSAPMFDIYRFGTGTWSRPAIQGVFNTASAIGFENTPTPDLGGLLGGVKDVVNFFRGVGEVIKDPLNPREAWYRATRDGMTEALVERPSFGWISGAFDSIIPSIEDEKLRAIQTPVLIGSAGHEDLVDNIAHAKAAELMPNAKHVTFPEAGHGLWHQRQAEYDAWTANIAHFLDGVTARWDAGQPGPDIAPANYAKPELAGMCAVV